MLTINSSETSGLRATLQCSDGHLLLVDDPFAVVEPGRLNQDWEKVGAALEGVEIPYSTQTCIDELKKLGYCLTNWGSEESGHKAMTYSIDNPDYPKVEAAPDPGVVVNPGESIDPATATGTEPSGDQKKEGATAEGLTDEEIQTMPIDELRTLALGMEIEGSADMDEEELRGKVAESLK